MGFLERLEAALQVRLEGQGLDHPYEAALALWRLLAAHPRPGGFCPHVLSTPVPLDELALRELRAHLEERSFRLAAPLRQVQGPLGVSFGARVLVEVLGGPSAGKVGLGLSRLLIGRAPECDLRLGDPSVSRRHCTVSAELELVDLGSRQGVSVDGRRVGSARLRSGQIFRVAATHEIKVVAVD